MPPAAAGAARPVRAGRSAAVRAGRDEAVRGAVPAAGGRVRAGGVPADPRCRGAGRARGGARPAVRPAAGRRRARPSAQRPAAGRGTGRPGQARGGLRRRDTQELQEPAVRHRRPRDPSQRAPRCGRDAGRNRVGHAARPRDGAQAGLRRDDHPHGDGCGRRSGRASVGACGCSPRRRPNDCGSETGAVPIPGAVRPRNGRTRITSFIGPMAARATSTTPPCSANGITRSCTSGDTRGSSCRTRPAPGSSGTCDPDPTTSCSPASRPENPRDPAPHPALGRGRIRACRLMYRGHPAVERAARHLSQAPEPVRRRRGAHPTRARHDGHVSTTRPRHGATRPPRVHDATTTRRDATATRPRHGRDTGRGP